MTTKNRRASRLVLVVLSALALCVSVLAGPVAAGTVTAPSPILTPGNTTMQVNWAASTTSGGATITGYTASISPDPGGVSPVPLGPGATTYTFTGLASGTSHLVTIVATDSDLDTASGDATASTTTPASAPNAPSVTRAALGTTGVTVNWTNNNLNGSTVTNYTVSLTASAGGVAPANQTIAAGTLTTTFTGLAPGNYVANVVINSNNGSSPAGSAGSITIATPASAPNAPSVTRAALGTTGVTVNWTNNNLNGSTVTNYTVSLTASAGGVAPANQTIAAGTLTTTFTGLAPGNYVANVVINSNNGSSPAGSAGSITIAPPAATIPATPTIPVNGGTSVSGGSVTVNFSVPTLTGSSAPESYRIRLFADDGSPSPIASAQASNAQVGISGGDLNGSWTLSTSISGQYKIDVSATNSAGTSAAATRSGIIVAITPGAPTSVTAASAADQVTINWNPPATTGGSIDHYLVTFDGKTTKVNAPTTTLVVSGVAAGTYTATVRAVNTVPRQSAAASSNSVTVIVAASAPTNVKGVATGQTVVVTWNAPANSGGSPVQSYKATLNGVNQTVVGTIRKATFTNVPFGEHVATVVATTGVGAGAVASSPAIDVKRAFEPFNTDEKFVEQLYRDILGRNADAGGRDYWASLINGNPNNVPTVVEAFLNSPEFGPRRPIIRLYLAYFNRAPDAGGFDYWTNLYVNRTVSLLDASHLFSTSPEFTQTYGNLSDGQFVVLVYNNVLGRSPDVGGFNFWVNRLSSGLSRAGLMIEFSESPEFLKVSKNFVDITMVYRGMLNRIPTNPASTNEFNVWLPRLAGSETIDDLIMDIFDGDEYEARVTP